MQNSLLQITILELSDVTLQKNAKNIINRTHEQQESLKENGGQGNLHLNLKKRTVEISEKHCGKRAWKI